MKFTKTVAQALANKVRADLVTSRREFLDNFAVSAEKSEELKALIAEKFELSARLEAINKLLQKEGPVDYSYRDTQEDLYKKYVRRIGENSLKSLPSTNALIDDFLIESLEAEDANELIAKVTAKYAA